MPKWRGSSPRGRDRGRRRRERSRSPESSREWRRRCAEDDFVDPGPTRHDYAGGEGEEVEVEEMVASACPGELQAAAIWRWARGVGRRRCGPEEGREDGGAGRGEELGFRGAEVLGTSYPPAAGGARRRPEAGVRGTAAWRQPWPQCLPCSDREEGIFLNPPDPFFLFAKRSSSILVNLIEALKHFLKFHKKFR